MNQRMRGFNYFKFFAAMCAVLLLAACSALFTPYNRITLRLDDSEAVCEVGDIVIVSLDSNPTTGYDWTPVSYNSSILKLESRNFIKSSEFMRRAENIVSAGAFEANELVGAAGVTEIAFVAQHPGESEIKLEYERPWEGKSTREAVFKIKVMDDTN